MDKPNLFQFAKGELSQDAFICWLASWADPAHKANHEALHTTAVAFLNKLFEAGKTSKPDGYRSIKIHRQRNGIDILLEVNGDAVIIIEDKTNTTHHDNQLERYKKAVADEYPEHRIAAVYLKTGDDGNYRSVEAAGYGCFLRQAFLAVLDQGVRAGVRNDIFADFHQHLRGIEEDVQSYQRGPVEKWGDSRRPWRGFFMALKERLGEGEWDDKGAPGGGAPAFRWHWRENKFLRVMQNELCFRIKVEDETQRPEKWSEWKSALEARSKTAGIEITFLVRRLGLHMGVAKLKEDYRQVDEKGLLDMEKTVDVLKKAEALMDAALGI
jgi:hypothetical protein